MKQEWDNKLECFLKASLRKNTAVVRKQASTSKRVQVVQYVATASVPAAFVSCFLSGFNHFFEDMQIKQRLKFS